MKDLTKGRPAPLIWGFAIPILLGCLLQLTYSLVDTRIVGSYLGEDALAAVGATTTLSNLIIGFITGICNGFAIVTAQRFGAGDEAGVKRSFATTVRLGTIIVAMVTVLGLVFLKPILHFLNVPEDLFAISYEYIFIVILGFMATLFYNAFASSLRAIGDTVTPLVILGITVILNIVGDLFFILVLKTGVGGAAFATVLSQLVAAISCFIYMVKRYEVLRLSWSDLRESDAQLTKIMLRGGLSMGFMMSLVNIGSLTLQTAINKLGQDLIVAHTAARKITEIFMLLLGVFGQTMATYCGQNMGAGKISRVKTGLKLSILYTFIWCTLVLIASRLFGEQLVIMVTGSDNPIVLQNATDYLVFNTTFYYVTAVICVVRNAMQGLGEHIIPLVSSSLEMVGKVVIAATLVPWFGYKGVIVSEPIVWFIMVIPLVVRILRMPVLKEADKKGV